MPEGSGVSPEANTTRDRPRQLLLAAAGLWLLVAPFALGAAGPALGNDLVVGAALLLLTLFRTLAPRFQQAGSWLVPGLGGWLMVAPLLLAYQHVGAIVNDVVVGLVVLVTGLWDAVAGR